MWIRSTSDQNTAHKILSHTIKVYCNSHFRKQILYTPFSTCMTAILYRSLTFMDILTLKSFTGEIQSYVGAALNQRVP